MSIRGSRGRIPVLSAIAAFLLGCTVAHGQLIDCRDPGPADSFKIFVDEVRTSDTSPPSAEVRKTLQAIRRILTENLTMSAKVASSGTSATELGVRDCGQRFPRDASDFDDHQFDSLDNLRVILEVWGVLDNSAKGSGAIGFALVPARPLAPPAVYVVPSPNLLNSLRQGTQVSAFAPLVLGIRRFQNHAYAEAVPLLCSGMGQLAPVLNDQSALSDPAFRTRQQALVASLNGIINSSIVEARKISGSPYNLLTPANNGTFACPR
jgi:hypothetical protein